MGRWVVQNPALRNVHALGTDGVQDQGSANAMTDGPEKTVQNVSLISMEQILALLSAMQSDRVLGMEGVRVSILGDANVSIRFLG
jgi:hypothetical protein